MAIEPALETKAQRRLHLLLLLQVDVALEVVFVKRRHLVDVRALRSILQILASEFVNINGLVSIVSLEELLHTFLAVSDLCDLGSLRQRAVVVQVDLLCGHGAVVLLRRWLIPL